MSVASLISAQPKRLRQVKVRDYLIRFAFGGLVTAAVGLIGAGAGPKVAGLFLAFPAILVASLTLLANKDGPEAAGVDALGASIGSIGLIAFGVFIALAAPRIAGCAALALATVGWCAVSLSLWLIVMVVRRTTRAD